MTVSFYIQNIDTTILYKYIEDYGDEDDNNVIYVSNQPTNPHDILVTISFYKYNELVDLELLEWI